MDAVPSLYEHLRSRGERSKTQPFLFVAEEQKFQIGEVAVDLSRFDPDSYFPHGLGIDYEGIDVDAMPGHAALLLGYGALIGGPKLHQWAQSHPTEVLGAIEVMKNAYASISPSTPLLSDGSSFGYWDFNAGLYADGSLGLQVQGDCACLSSTPDGRTINDRFEHGFAEYELHNTDTPAQRSSLYAGFGHLARLASE